jgi:hypothetical protein
MIIQLLEIQPDVAQLIETSRPFACWCFASGKQTRHVIAGDPRCSFTITTRNIINKPVACVTEEPLEFRGRLSSIRVTQRSPAVHNNGVSTIVVRFAAPAKVGTALLHVLLHGHHLFGSPMNIRVVHGAPHVAATSVASSFNTVVEKKPFHVELQLRDQFGNPVTTSCSKAMKLVVEGPPPTAEGRITVKCWRELRPGIIDVEMVAQAAAQRCTIPIRLQSGSSTSVVPFSVEVVGQGVPQQLRAARSTPQNRLGLYFRSNMRRAELARRRREVQEALGGSNARKFPLGHT